MNVAVDALTRLVPGKHCAISWCWPALCHIIVLPALCHIIVLPALCHIAVLPASAVFASNQICFLALNLMSPCESAPGLRTDSDKQQSSAK